MFRDQAEERKEVKELLNVAIVLDTLQKICCFMYIIHKGCKERFYR